MILVVLVELNTIIHPKRLESMTMSFIECHQSALVSFLTTIITGHSGLDLITQMTHQSGEAPASSSTFMSALRQPQQTDKIKQLHKDTFKPDSTVVNNVSECDCNDVKQFIYELNFSFKSLVLLSKLLRTRFETIHRVNRSISAFKAVFIWFFIFMNTTGYQLKLIASLGRLSQRIGYFL